jgi:hypothetical protein
MNPINDTSIIWGNSNTVIAIAMACGSKPIVTHYNDGQKVTSVAVSFEGGYDDYNGSCAWAEVPGDYPGKPTRFSPRPGKWMSGVRV